MKNQLTLLLACITLLASCRSPHSSFTIGKQSQSTRLALSESKDGTRSEWRLYPGRREDPRLELTESTVGLAPKIGAKLSAVTRKRAESAGVSPFQGVWVTTVEPDGAAYEAGLRNGDIIQSLAGIDMNSPEQFADTLATYWVPDDPLDLTAWIQPRPNFNVPAEMVQLEITPTSVNVRTERTDSFELATSSGIQSYTGLQVAELPASLALSIFGEESPTVLVSGIIPGSPAYHAGFRGGDRILICDGLKVTKLDHLRSRVGQRLHQRYPKADSKDLPPANGDFTGPKTIPLTVHGPLGIHSADLKVTDTLNHHSDVHIPILLDYESNVERTKISFLDFIFQFGFNYSSQVRSTASRTGASTSKLSILPLGMFEVEHGIKSSRYRLFWLISWRRSRK